MTIFEGPIDKRFDGGLLIHNRSKRVTASINIILSKVKVITDVVWSLLIESFTCRFALNMAKISSTY